ARHSAHFSALPVRASSPPPSIFSRTSQTDIHPLSLHDALPISPRGTSTNRTAPCRPGACRVLIAEPLGMDGLEWSGSPSVGAHGDRKSTRLNSSHVSISHAGFCVKKKKTRTRKHSICSDED